MTLLLRNGEFIRVRPGMITLHSEVVEVTDDTNSLRTIPYTHIKEIGV